MYFHVFAGDQSQGAASPVPLKKDVENMEKGKRRVFYCPNDKSILLCLSLTDDHLFPRLSSFSCRGAPEGSAGADRLQEATGAGVSRSEGHLTVSRLP